MAGNKGGARPGAGRKRNADKYAPQLASFAASCAGHLPTAFEKLRELIDGFEKVETKRVPAGMATRKEVLFETVEGPDGLRISSPVLNRAGKPQIVEVQAFPDLPPDQLVTVEVKTSTMAPEIRAIQELIHRVGGRPFAAEDEAVEPQGFVLDPAALADLTPSELDALESIAGRLAEGRPLRGPGGGPGGEGDQG